MIKICLLIALAVTAVCAQEPEGAPEPYAYAYETDSHAASEQKTPDGKVTGFYTLVDADGRQRRVEYIADEQGFRAKVQTNEVGTRSQSPANVELIAEPPTREQLVQAEQAATLVTKQPVVTQVAQVAQVPQVQQRQVQYTTTSTPYTYAGYQNYAYPGGLYGVYGNSVYGNGVYGNGVYGNGVYGNGAQYGYRYGYASQPASAAYSTSNAVYGGYNSVPVNVGSTGYYSSYSYPAASYGYSSYGYPLAGSYQTIGVPASAGRTRAAALRTVPVTQTVSVPVTQTVSVPASNAGVAGSSNYILLKKRDSTEAQAADSQKSQSS